MTVRWYLPLLLWSMLILILTWYPKIEMPDLGFDAQDKAAHWGVFFIFGILSLRAFSKYEIKRLPTAVFTTVFLGSGFALIDEVVQRWIPGRSFDPLDGLFNLLGVITAVLLFGRMILPFVQRQRIPW